MTMTTTPAEAQPSAADLSAETAALIEKLSSPWHHGDCKKAAAELGRLSRAVDDLVQQLWDAQRQHEITQGVLAMTKTARDESQAETAAEREGWATTARLVLEATPEQMPMALDALRDLLGA